MFWVFGFNVKENRADDFRKWLASDNVRKLIADIEKETGVRYLDTYWSIMGFGKFDCEDWWEVPNWAAFDKWHQSKAAGRLWSEVLEFAEFRPFRARMLRGSKDVKTVSPDS